MKSLKILALAAALAAGATVPALAGTGAPTCTRDHLPGGEWPMYGHDVANTRSQPDETTLTPAVAATVEKAWTFTADGAINVTPAVADGCIFFGTETGHIYALDAGDGSLVWDRLEAVPASGLGGTIVGSPAIVGHNVIFFISKLDGPYALALDMRTGDVRWQSEPVDSEPGSYTNASAVVFDGVLFYGFSAPEGQSGAQGGWALLDAGDGTIIKTVDTIPPGDQGQYAGGGIWSTPAYDPATGYAYIGAGNPFSKTVEHDYTNSILKVDLDRSRATFGEVVGFYKGNVDQYSSDLQTLSQTPACAASDVENFAWPLDDPVCGQLDLDFGASPNLFEDASGRRLVGDLQKSGVYHVAVADNMSPAWTALVGLSCAACNAASTAFDGSSIIGVGAPGGVTFALDRTDGASRWSSPVGDGSHYQPMVAAAGVVYTIDDFGFLDAWNAATGDIVLRKPITPDAGAATVQLGSGGVVIAMHTVFAPVSTSLVAYRAP